MKQSKTHVLFRTINPCHVSILRQPFIVIEKYTTPAAKKGKVKRRRKAQYCEDLESIFIDEQKQIDEKPIITPQYFKKSDLLVEKENITLLEAMRLHEDNVANGGKIFKEVDVTKEQVDQIKALRELDELRTYVMVAEDENVMTMGLFYLGHSSLSNTVQGVRLKLREKVETNQRFRESLMQFKLEGNKVEKTIVTLALSKDVIQLYGKDFKWADSGESIYIAPQMNDCVKSFANWLVNDEKGRQVYSALVDKVESSD